MGTDTYYLELIPIFLNVFQPQKLINKTMKAEISFLKKKDKRHQKKKLGCKFIRTNTSNAKRVMIQIMKLVEHKYLSVNLKKKNK